jgi:hypothetical protein
MSTFFSKQVDSIVEAVTSAKVPFTNLFVREVFPTFAKELVREYKEESTFTKNYYFGRASFL